MNIQEQDMPLKPTVVSSKDELISNIKDWIKLDNEIAKMKSDLKEKQTKQKS
jgi:hypothetical protein